MRITALDLSLTLTGYAIGGIRNPREAKGTIPTAKLRGFRRVALIRRRVLDLVDGSDLVVLEGYSFGSKGRAVFDIAELGGVIRMTLHDLGFEWVEIAPSTVKKFATGRGNAPKEEVLVAAVQRLDYDGHDNNEADALWLLEAAMTRYRITEPMVPKSHLAALDAVEWPTLNGGGE